MKYGKFILIFVFSLTSFGLKAQEPGNTGSERSLVSKQLQRLKWEMNLGTSFTYLQGYGGGMNYFAAPGFTMPLDERWAVHGGIITGVSRFPAITNSESETFAGSGFTSIYGSVSYRLSNNVIVYGTGIKNINRFGMPNPYAFPSYDEFSIGSSIRLGDNITVGASLHFRDSGSYGTGFYSPFFR